MTEAEKDQFRSVPLSTLRSSATNPRKTFNETRLGDLTLSIQKRGVMQPLLVRVHPTDSAAFEIIAGERRFRAATRAKVETVPVRVLDLDDKGVLEVQVIENLQREDVHQLEESEGYQRLIKEHGYSVVDIAAKIGKSEEYVAKRLKLRDLVAPAARKAFLADELAAGVAFALARIPNAKLQAEAFLRVASLTPGQAVRVIQEQYMLTLAKAPFDTEMPDLIPSAGACGPCPNRTGNQANLFGDVGSKDVCTNPTCFSAKRKAAAELRIDHAKRSGVKVIEGAAAKKLSPHGDHHIQGHIALDAKCWEDSKSRTYRQILGRALPDDVALLASPHSEGKLIEIIPEAAFKKAAKEIGFLKGRDGQERGPAAQKALDKAKKTKERQKMLRAVITETTAEIVEQLESGRKSIEPALQALLANHRMGHEVLERHDLVPAKKAGQYVFDGAVLKATETLGAEGMVALLVESDVANVCRYIGDEYPRIVTNLAQAYGVDLKKLEKDYGDTQVKRLALKKAGKAVDDAIAMVHASHPPKKPASGAPKTTMALALANAKPGKVGKKKTEPPLTKKGMAMCRGCHCTESQPCRFRRTPTGPLEACSWATQPDKDGLGFCTACADAEFREQAIAAKKSAKKKAK